jgi:hypothetical protein
LNWQDWKRNVFWDAGLAAQVSIHQSLDHVRVCPMSEISDLVSQIDPLPPNSGCR